MAKNATPVSIRLQHVVIPTPVDSDKEQYATPRTMLAVPIHVRSLRPALSVELRGIVPAISKRLVMDPVRIVQPTRRQRMGRIVVIVCSVQVGSVRVWTNNVDNREVR